MKVVHFSNSDFRGATARAVLALHQQLLEGGVRSRFFAKECFQEGTEPISSFEPEFFAQLAQATCFDGNLTHELVSNFTLGLPSSGRLDASAAIDADIIHLHDIKGLFSPQTIGNLLSLGKPVVWSLSDMWAFTGGCHHALDCTGYQQSCNNCPQIKENRHGLPALLLEKKRTAFAAPNLHIITPTNWIGKSASTSRVFGQTAHTTIPSVASSELHPQLKHEAKAQLGLDAEVFTLLVLCENTGRQERHQNALKQLLENCALFNVFPKLARKRKLCILTLGTAPEEWRSDFRVIHGGDATNYQKLSLYLSAADLAVLPHFEENASQAVWEAATCFTPIIAMDAEGTEEFICNGINGKLVPVGNLNRLAEEISYAILHQHNKEEQARSYSTTLTPVPANGLAHHRELYDRLLEAYPTRPSARIDATRLTNRDSIFEFPPMFLDSVAKAAQAPGTQEKAALESVETLRRAIVVSIRKLATAEQRIQKQLREATYSSKIESSVISIQKLRKYLGRSLSEQELVANRPYLPPHTAAHPEQASPKFAGVRQIRERILKWMYISFLKKMHIAKPGVLAQYPPRSMALEKFPRPRTRARKLPTIAIVTPSYMQGRFIEQTILSVIDQNYPKLRYAVQDAGSADATVEILKKHSSRITTWVSEPDTGQARAVASGFERISGDIMAWLNSDDLLMPGALRYVGEYFRKHPEVDAIYGHRVNINEEGEEIGRWVLPPHDPEVLRSVDYVPQETLFWRTELWRKVGGISTNFRFALDWDLLLRFQKAGANIVRVPYYLGCFRIHTLQKTSSQMETIGNHEVSFLRLITPGALIDREQFDVLSQRFMRESAFYAWLLRCGIRW